MYWLITLLALIQLAVGWSLDYFPKASQGADTVALIHLGLGAGLAALVIIVPIWRLFARSSDQPSFRPHWLQISLAVSESLLFILVLVSALTGYLAWAFSAGATPTWTIWLPSSLPVGSHAGPMFSRWHAIAAIAVTVPILTTLLLLAWGALKRQRMKRQRRVLEPHQAASVPEPGATPETAPDADLVAKVQALARHLKIFGTTAFWLQLCLGLVAVLLLVVTTSSSYYEENLSTLPYGFSWAHGILWAYLSLGVLALNVIGFYAVILFSRSLRRGEVPSSGGAGVRRLVSGINFGNALGLTLAIVGTAFSIALLISKTVSQPPGIAITDPQAIVRAVDVFVLLANFVIVVAHFIGIMICLWILNRLHRFAL